MTAKRHTSFEVLISFVKAYPRRTLTTIAFLMISSIMEAFGVALLFPVLSLLSAGEDGAQGKLNEAISGIFSTLSLPLSLEWLLLASTGLIVGKSIVSLYAMREVGRTAARVTADLRIRLIRALLAARWKYFTALPAGQAAAAIGSEAERASLAYLMMCSALADMMLIAMYFILGLLVSWQVCLAGIAAGLVMTLMTRFIVRRTRRAAKILTENLNSLLRRLADSLASVKPIKAMGREDHYVRILQHDIEMLRASQGSRFFSREMLRLSREPILAVFLSAGLYASVSWFHMDLASVLILAVLFMRMVMKLMNVQTSYQQLAEHESGFWSLMSFIDEAEAQREPEGGTLPPKLISELTLNGLAFSHGDAALIGPLSASLPARKFYALIGPSGAGKTTLIDLILGFYTPDAGDVLLDGQKLSQTSRQGWRSRIGYVPQDCILLNDTVMQNVTLGDETIPEERVLEALRQAGAEYFVNDLPAGLQESVGERGMRLSGGQRQRIAIARALVQSPFLLLLDEPTSALDAGTGKQLMQTLREIAQSVTVIVISHNDDARAFADMVYELKAGQLVAVDTAGKAA